MTDGWLMDLFDSPLAVMPPIEFFTRCSWCGANGGPMHSSSARNSCGGIMMIFVCCPCCAADEEDAADYDGDER